MNMKGSFLRGLLVAVFILFLFKGSFIYTQQNDKTINGIVTESDWDEDGNVTAVAIEVTIETEDEDEESYSSEESDYYDVVMDDKGKELMNFLNKMVEVTGTVTEDDEGNKTIKVKKYKVLEK